MYYLFFLFMFCVSLRWLVWLGVSCTFGFHAFLPTTRASSSLQQVPDEEHNEPKGKQLFFEEVITLMELVPSRWLTNHLNIFIHLQHKGPYKRPFQAYNIDSVKQVHKIHLTLFSNFIKRLEWDPSEKKEQFKKLITLNNMEKSSHFYQHKEKILNFHFKDIYATKGINARQEHPIKHWIRKGRLRCFPYTSFVFSLEALSMELKAWLKAGGSLGDDICFSAYERCIYQCAYEMLPQPMSMLHFLLSLIPYRLMHPYMVAQMSTQSDASYIRLKWTDMCIKLRHCEKKRSKVMLEMIKEELTDDDEPKTPLSKKDIDLTFSYRGIETDRFHEEDGEGNHIIAYVTPQEDELQKKLLTIGVQVEKEKTNQHLLQEAMNILSYRSNHDLFGRIQEARMLHLYCITILLLYAIFYFLVFRKKDACLCESTCFGNSIGHTGFHLGVLITRFKQTFLPQLRSWKHNLHRLVLFFSLIHLIRTSQYQTFFHAPKRIGESFAISLVGLLFSGLGNDYITGSYNTFPLYIMGWLSCLCSIFFTEVLFALRCT